MLSGPFAGYNARFPLRYTPPNKSCGGLKVEIMSAVINIIIAFPTAEYKSKGCATPPRALTLKKLFWDNKNIFACLRFKPFQLNKALKWASPLTPPVSLSHVFQLQPFSFVFRRVCACVLGPLLLFVFVCLFVCASLLLSFRPFYFWAVCCVYISPPMCVCMYVCMHARSVLGCPGENKMHINYNQK